MKRTKKRQSTRQRRLFHEQLEDRRLLTSGTGWLFGVGGLDTGVTDRDCDVDDDGNIFIAGAITGSGTVDMDPGPGVMELTAPAAYVAKYAPDGSALWSAEINTTYSVIWANEAAVDAEGNVYVVGSFWEEATFGDTTLTSQGESDAFVSKLDADGNFVWTVTARAADYVKAAGVDVDSAGDVYVTGYFAGSVSFGPFEVTSNGGYDAYVAKLNSNGELLWFQEVAGMENVVGLEVAVASDNSVYASGNFYGSADFGGLPLSSAGEQDAYIAKLSVDDGSVLWTRQVGGPSGDAVTEIAVDTQNNVAATGTLRGTVEFGAIQLSALRDYEAFVFEMDPTGAVLWARATEGADGNELGSASAIGIAFDDAGESVYVTGRTSGATDFDPGSAAAYVYQLPNQSQGFLWKLDSAGNFETVNWTAGDGNNYGDQVVVDGAGDVFWTGTFGSPTALFPNGSLALTGTRDMFVAKLPAPMISYTVLFSDSFENGEWNGLWLEDSQDDWYTSTQRAILGSYSAEVVGRAADATLTVANPIDLTPYGSVVLTFDWFLEKTYWDDEYLAVDLYDGSSWAEVARLDWNVDAENVWHQPIVQIPTDHLVENFQFRFRANLQRKTEGANLDNVQLVGTSLAGEPNNAPVAADDADTTLEDNGITVNVLANDSDPDGDTIQVGSVTDGTNGTVVDNGNGTVTYTPDANFHGTDSFTYRAYDGADYSDPATVTITVDPVNDAPVAVNDAATTPQDTPLIIQALTNDTDVDGDILAIDSFTQGANGTVSDNGDGTLTYTPSGVTTGDDSFTYTVSDGKGGTDTATVNVNVTRVNAAPVAVDDTYTTDEDTQLVGAVLGNDGGRRRRPAHSGPG